MTFVLRFNLNIPQYNATKILLFININKYTFLYFLDFPINVQIFTVQSSQYKLNDKIQGGIVDYILPFSQYYSKFPHDRYPSKKFKVQKHQEHYNVGAKTFFYLMRAPALTRGNCRDLQPGERRPCEST